MTLLPDPASITSVLLIDGWHTITAGSFTVDSVTAPTEYTFISASTGKLAWGPWPPLSLETSVPNDTLPETFSFELGGT